MRRVYKPVLGLYVLSLWGNSVQAQGIRITSGAHIVVNGQAQLVINNAGFTNNGAFEAGAGTVVFTGTAATGQSSIAGTQPVVFNNLTLSKPANDLELQRDIQVKSRLQLQTGNLQLNNYILDLQNTGVISGERNDARITGYNGGEIRTTAQLNAPQDLNPGNIGVAFTSNNPIGEVTIRRQHTRAGAFGICRTFLITPATGNAVAATMRFYYLQAELEGLRENDLTVWGQDAAQQWQPVGKDSMNTAIRWIQKSDLAVQGVYSFGQLSALPLRPVVRNPAGEEIVPMLIALYPNPVSHQLTLDIRSVKKAAGTVRIFDAAGRLWETKKISLSVGTNNLLWQVGRYPKGLYTMYFDIPGAKPVRFVRQ